MEQPPGHEVRELRYRLKQVNKTVGKQGETIHLLRAELAEVRELNSKIDRGDLRRLDRAVVKKAATIVALHEQIARLEEKLEAEDEGNTLARPSSPSPLSPSEAAQLHEDRLSTQLREDRR